VSLVDFTH